jgi:hypothetical protein
VTAKPEFLSTRSILSDFRGAACSVCGLFKKSKQSFCSNCYHSLPGFMQSNLYRPIGKGYEEAFRVARMWLLNLREAAKGVGA